MSTLLTNDSSRATPTDAARSRPGSVLLYLIRCEVLKLLRVPMFAVPTFVFPIMFFAMFGLPNLDNTLDGISAGAYMMASYGAYSVMSVALFSFGVAIAAERGLGWNKLLRATPLRPLTAFISKVAMALLFGAASLTALFVFGAVVGRVRMPLLTWLELGSLLVLGMIPFVALGLFIGYLAGPNSAAAVANLIFLPLAFASGLFLPLKFLPDLIQTIAPYLPAYHTGELGWGALGAGDGKGVGYHLLWLAGYTVVFLALALVAYWRDEGKKYG
ncbi:MAG: ABC transporter permease [Chloroflexi bacterium]|nr:ABC transporter permease [Chloroflexota bacterium]